MHNSIKNKKGFTLVEMLVAIGLFTLVASISMGAVITIFDANNKSQTSKTVVDNLNLAIEDMTRTVRFGNNYNCDDEGDLDQPGDCSNAEFLSVTFQGNIVVYKKCGNQIKRSSTPGGVSDCESANMVAITSSDTNIEQMSFYVRGSSPSDNIQPYALALIRGYVGNKPTTQTSFTIQTMMAQRNLDHDL